MMKFFITGGAGFIGSNLCDFLLQKGQQVVVFDNFSTGHEVFLSAAKTSNLFSLCRGDIRDFDHLSATIKSHQPDWIIHLAANADVRHGTEHTRLDLEQNTIGTWNVLESARLAACTKIFFSSTGSVYGEPDIFPTPECAAFPVQTSFYGASKLAAEGLVAAFCAGFNFTALVFRFVSILGPRYTHGHVYDFVKQLLEHPNELRVLGDGNQNKSYLHVNDLIEGIWLLIQKSSVSLKPEFQVFNIGHDDTLSVKQSIAIITKAMKLSPQLNFSGGIRGWIGDSPKIQLDLQKLKDQTWSYRHSLEESVLDTVNYLLQNQQLLSSVRP